MLLINYSKKKGFFCKDPHSISILSNGFYGSMKKAEISLNPEEALYLLDVRNSKLLDEKEKEINLSQIIEKLSKNERFFARYTTYKDWRDRGLIPKGFEEEHYEGSPACVNYKPEPLSLKGFTGFSASFFPDDLISISLKGKEFYDEFWFGQFGTYKADHRGLLLKLDIFETIFLMERKLLKIKGFTPSRLKKLAEERFRYFPDMYNVYEDWREKGFVLKTGFKFGTHFRIYLPGISPGKTKGWLHSKHVIHIFPRRSRMLISEWARAIRVAHSVKKTFILAIPGKKTTKKAKADFVLFHRIKGGITTPKKHNPKYLMLSLSEDEYLGGMELASSIKLAQKTGLEPLLGIADRESSVTYYQIKKINLPKSKYEYYEIEWLQP
ncbi:tRNA-intron lyase [Candidatus Micrarchaeota archaeon]|nr:tRNA-intron lyase [Candidatus Micrarchaeota archaeon]